MTNTYYRDGTGQWWSFSINPDGSAETAQVSPQGPTTMATTYSYYEDSTGQWWSFSINPDGSAETTQVSAPAPGPTPTTLSYANSSIQLLNTMEWAKRFIGNRSMAIGDYLEPALTSASIVRETILGAPFRWRWNRVVTGFYTAPGVQDYYLFNWQADTAVEAGWCLLDVNGNCQTAATPGITGSVYPTWNKDSGGPTVDGTGATSITWINQGSLEQSSTVDNYDFGWMETVSLQDQSSAPYQWIEMEPKICLGADSRPGRPRYISAQGDDGSGNISFRVMPVPTEFYPIAITIQQAPQLFTSVYQTWEPIPDNYCDVYQWGFLAHMLLFSDDARFQLANQKFVTALLGRNQGLTQTEVNIFLNNWQEITGQPIANQSMLGQGINARGV